MSTLTDIFSNRELATLAWMTVIIVALVLYTPMRKPLADLVRAFCQRIILTALTVASVYIGLCVWLMTWRGLWTIDNLKTTIIWAVSFAFVTMFDVARVQKDKTFFGSTIRETIGITAAILFVVEFYSFPLWIELALLPTLTFVQLLQATAERDAQTKPVSEALKTVLALVGYFYVGYSVYQTVVTPQAFFALATFREFVIPILLSALFLPFIYLFGLYASYEQNFVPLQFAIDDPALRRYAKRTALKRFRADVDFLNRWQRRVQSERPSSRAAVDAIFSDLNALKVREADPPVVPISDGWSPSTATGFLAGEGLPTRDYHPSFEDAWFASSSLLDIGEADGFGLKNSLGYYIDGNERAATALKLKLNVNDPTDADRAEERFVAVAEILIEAALGPGTRERLAPRLAALNPFSADLPNGRVVLEDEVWLNLQSGGYGRKLTLSRGHDTTNDGD